MWVCHIYMHRSALCAPGPLHQGRPQDGRSDPGGGREAALGAGPAARLPRHVRMHHGGPRRVSARSGGGLFVWLRRGVKCVLLRSQARLRGSNVCGGA